MRRLLLLPALALAAPLLVASPASAATVDTFTIAGTTDDIEATVGTTLEVAWDVTAVDPAATVAVTPAGTAVDVVDGWNAAAVAAATDSSVDVTIPADAEVGDEYTFQLVVAEDGVAPTVSDVISVYVSETLTVVTPAPVLAADCAFTVPEVEGVTYDWLFDYSFDEDGSGWAFSEEIEPGTYPLARFTADGEDVLIAASPAEGYAIPDDTDSFYELTVPEDCLVGPTFVEVDTVCQGLTVTNLTDETVEVYYGDADVLDTDGHVSLPPGASRAVETRSESVMVVAGVGLDIDETDEDDLIDAQFEYVDVDQTCGEQTVDISGAGTTTRPTHPTVAPAAGR